MRGYTIICEATPSKARQGKARQGKARRDEVRIPKYYVQYLGKVRKNSSVSYIIKKRFALRTMPGLWTTTLAWVIMTNETSNVRRYIIITHEKIPVKENDFSCEKDRDLQCDSP
ncbi:hypothetical protein M0804_002887 [Polistes exclamans]|nr:hypothetical protein M0804_002887 [Polistes exclamans]